MELGHLRTFKSNIIIDNSENTSSTLEYTLSLYSSYGYTQVDKLIVPTNSSISFSRATGIKKIVMYGNKISTLKMLYALQELIICSDKFNTLPLFNSDSPVYNLKKYKFNANNITTLPDYCGYRSLITNFTISPNLITAPKSTILVGMGKLKTLTIPMDYGYSLNLSTASDLSLESIIHILNSIKTAGEEDTLTITFSNCKQYELLCKNVINTNGIYTLNEIDGSIPIIEAFSNKGWTVSITEAYY